MTTITDADIEIAVQAATSFVQLYYAAYDGNTRIEEVPKLYRSYSSISWNGNPVAGPEGLAEMLKEMPASAHTVQSFDCHPVPNTQGPSLMVTVSGTVQHGPTPPTALASVEKKEKSRSVDGQPRVFAQTFVLTRESESGTGGSEPGKLGKYVIRADTLRFVG